MDKKLAATLLAGGIAYLFGSTARNLSKQEGLVGMGIGVTAGALGAWLALSVVK